MKKLKVKDNKKQQTFTDYYKSQDVCKITGLTYKQLDYYDRTKFLSPSVNQALGYGTKRMYSFNDLLKLKVVKNLLDAGISLHKIRKTKKYLEMTGNGGDDFLKVTLISDGTTVYACYSDKEIIDTLNSGQAVFGIALEKVYNKLKKDVDNFLIKNNYLNSSFSKEKLS
ncbi:MAG: MerR family transcriptional regulator [Actinomycetota bacterium]|nr:MerR family transcriptional regulator [Actinomycetota bacterium]